MEFIYGRQGLFIIFHSYGVIFKAIPKKNPPFPGVFLDQDAILILPFEDHVWSLLEAPLL